jgi:hypothetical protein
MVSFPPVESQGGMDALSAKLHLPHDDEAIFREPEFPPIWLSANRSRGAFPVRWCAFVIQELNAARNVRTDIDRFDLAIQAP